MNRTEAQFSQPSEDCQSESNLGQFQHHFHGWMGLCAKAPAVADYLDAHQGWFQRCARPMKVETLGETGYALGVGRYGAFGFKVEPKIGLQLVPQGLGAYRIESVSVPGHEPTLYAVDFQAQLCLHEPTQPDCQTLKAEAPEIECRAVWNLDLSVWLRFPGFVQKLPRTLIRKTGDRVLVQVVLQVSRRLTQKVQEDFHESLGISFPPKLERGQKLWECRPSKDLEGTIQLKEEVGREGDSD